MMIFVDNAFKEGWNPSSYDAEYYYKADPNGLLNKHSAVHSLDQRIFVLYFLY